MQYQAGTGFNCADMSLVSVFGESAYVQHVPRLSNTGSSGFMSMGPTNPGVSQDFSGSNGLSIPWGQTRTEYHGAESDAHTVNLDVGPVCESFKIDCVAFMKPPTGKNVTIPRGTVVKVSTQPGGETKLCVFNPDYMTNRKDADQVHLGLADKTFARYSNGLVSVLASDLTIRLDAVPHYTTNSYEIQRGQTCCASIVMMGTCEMFPLRSPNYSKKKKVAGMIFEMEVPCKVEGGTMVYQGYGTTFVVKLRPIGPGPITVYVC